MKRCELCSATAAMYCESDSASLCWDCDAKVHSANFLVERHSRSLLCHVCQSSTAWTATGPKLGRTVSVCEGCVGRAKGLKEEREERDCDETDTEEEDGYEDKSEDGEGFEDDDDVEDEEEQVVPWTWPPVPPPVSSSSSGEESSSGNAGVSSKRVWKETADFISDDDCCCSSTHHEIISFSANGSKRLKTRTGPVFEIQCGPSLLRTTSVFDINSSNNVEAVIAGTTLVVGSGSADFVAV